MVIQNVTPRSFNAVETPNVLDRKLAIGDSVAGPMAAAANRMPDALPRMSGNQRCAVVSVGLYTRPFPMPAITPWQIYSIGMLVAMPVRNQPRPNTSPPTSMTFRGPNLSEMRPEKMPVTAMTVWKMEYERLTSVLLHPFCSLNGVRNTLNRAMDATKNMTTNAADKMP